MSSKVMYVPRKRKIKKIIGSDQVAPSAGSLNSATLYTAVEDGETLSRIVGNICVQVPLAGASGSGHVAFAIYLQRDAAGPASLIADISGREAESILWTQVVKTNRIQNVAHTYYNIEVDTKSQRKLRAGDVIKLGYHPIGLDPEVAYMLNQFVKMP